MSIVTGRQFRANQGKYIDMAHKGERVIISSKKGFAELKPVSDNDKDIKDYKQSISFITHANKVLHDYKMGKGITLKSHEDVDKYFDSL